MKFCIQNSIFNKFPDLIIGVIIGRQLVNRKRNEMLEGIICNNVNTLIEKVQDKELLSFTNLSAWRETYSLMGVKSSKYKPTAEAFIRHVLKTKYFPSISSIVDAYLAVELIYMLPIGGYDLSMMQGDIVLRTSPGNENFVPIGGTEQVTETDEIVYSDEKQILTRYWNYRDSNNTKITENTTDIILFTEAAHKNINKQDVNDTMHTIEQYCRSACGGTYHIDFLDKSKMEIEIK